MARSARFSPAAPNHVTAQRPSPRPVSRKTALAAGNHEVKPSVAIQIAGLDRGGRASDGGVEAMEGELAGGVGRWGCEGEGSGGEYRECGGKPRGAVLVTPSCAARRSSSRTRRSVGICGGARAS